MKCPKCNNPRYAYIEKRPLKTKGMKNKFKRNNFKTKCNKCGYNGYEK